MDHLCPERGWSTNAPFKGAVDLASYLEILKGIYWANGSNMDAVAVDKGLPNGYREVVEALDMLWMKWISTPRS